MRFSIAVVAVVSSLVGLTTTSLAQLGPPPVPDKNKITEPKRVLGKLLFWDEQLSTHDTISCGGCHQPAMGGSDGRFAIHPGNDHFIPSADDVRGSAGVIHMDEIGAPVPDPIFGTGTQVTYRNAATVIGAAYAAENFIDGRAGPAFLDPETGVVSILDGAGLESQAAVPMLNSVEMARDFRTWDDVRRKLQHALPLRDATDLPPDLDAVVASRATYPQLFAAAFGDPGITGERIAYAIATYERTLIPDQTPWDRFMAGDTRAMTPAQVAGWDTFRSSTCSVCHSPPQFSDQTFHDLGLRPANEDPGRFAVTGSFADMGKFKTATLRNSGLKPAHMHNGRLLTLDDAVLWYRSGNSSRFSDNLDPLLPVNIPSSELTDLVDFIGHALTDPRVASETFPFDRPTVHYGDLPVLRVAADRATFSWPALTGARNYNVYRGTLAALRVLGGDGLPSQGFGVCMNALDPDTTDTAFVDPAVPAPGQGFFYLKDVVDGHGVERGLGATSDGRAHTVLSACPSPP